MAGVPFLRLNPRSLRLSPSFFAELAAEKLLQAAAVSELERAADAARAAAPVDAGDYRDSIRVEPVEDGDTIGRIVSDDYKAHWIEWGTVHHAPKAPLRRGVKAAGLRLREE